MGPGIHPRTDQRVGAAVIQTTSPFDNVGNHPPLRCIRFLKILDLLRRKLNVYRRNNILEMLKDDPMIGAVTWSFDMIHANDACAMDT